jgi:hypothetical protein
MEGDNMSSDIWSTLSKKKSTSITIPSKKTTTSTNNTTCNSTSAPNTATAKPVKTKPPKVQKHKVQHHQAQVAEPQINDFNVSTSADANGIYISIFYNGHPIYRFTLPKQDFDLWGYKLDSNQKFQYVRMRVTPGSFGNDMQIVQAVIASIYQILQNIFSEAQRMKQTQARRSMI